MDGLGPRFEERVRDVVQEGRVGVELRESDGLEFKAFASEVVVQEGHNRTFSRAGVEQRVEVGEDLLRGLGRRLVHDCLLVRVRLREVHRLEQLIKAVSAKRAHQDRPRTSPAQKISLGHHACFGGSGICDGRVFVRGAVGAGVAVDSVMEGTPVET